jgi:hypothetical protein
LSPRHTSLRLCGCTLGEDVIVGQAMCFLGNIVTKKNRVRRPDGVLVRHAPEVIALYRDRVQDYQLISANGSCSHCPPGQTPRYGAAEGGLGGAACRRLVMGLGGWGGVTVSRSCFHPLSSPALPCARPTCEGREEVRG